MKWSVYKKILSMGGYELEPLAYLVEYYLFEVTVNQFKDFLWRGTHRYDRFLVLKGRK